MEKSTFLEKCQNMLKNKGKMGILRWPGMLGTGTEQVSILRGILRVVKEAARQTARKVQIFDGWPGFGGGYPRTCNRQF